MYKLEKFLVNSWIFRWVKIDESMEVFIVQQNDDSLDHEEVVKHLTEKANVNIEEISKENVVVISGHQGDF